MSLNRLALRHQLMNVLYGEGLPNAPTMAGRAVFDSSITMPEHAEPNTVLPAILIYTDKDTHGQLDRGEGRRYRERTVSCVIVCLIGTFHKSEEEGAPLTWQVVQTDAEMEAMLDLFEWQVWRTIKNPAAPQNSKLNKLVKRYEEWQSEPARSAEQASKLAMRQITFDAVIANDCLPETAVLKEGESLLPLADTAYFDVSYLDALKTAIDTNPSLELLRDQLRSARTGVPIQSLPKLETISIKMDAIDPFDPNILEEGQTSGPDGRIEVQADIEMEG